MKKYINWLEKFGVHLTRSEAVSGLIAKGFSPSKALEFYNTWRRGYIHG